MTPKRQLFQGTGASPGLSSGKVMILPDFEAAVPRRSISQNELESEIERFHKACEVSKKQIAELVSSSNLPDEYREIFEAQILLLEDPMLVQETIEKVKINHYNPEWALATVVDSFRQIMSKTSDTRFRERLADVEDIANRILSNLTGITENDIRIPFLKSLNENHILVAEELSPSLLLWIRNKISGIVTEKGGVTGHTAILARDRGIPSLVGIENLMESVTENDIAFIDGDRGIFVINPGKKELDALETYRLENHESDHAFSPVSLMEGDPVRIWINLDDENSSSSSHIKDLHGVGLFRTEFLYLNNPDLFRSSKNQIEMYKNILKMADGKPITFRMLDVGDDKTFNIPLLTHANITQETGDLRGIRFLLNHPNLLQSQLRSIIQAAVELDYPEGECRIMLPMVTCLEEVHAFKIEIEKIFHELKLKRGSEIFPLGIMIETPSACMMTDILEKEADFFSFGTNDLANFTLALNRTESENQKYLFYQPSVFRMMKAAIDKTKLSISVCGEIAGMPSAVPILVGLGIQDLSVSWSSALRIVPVLEKLKISDAKSLTDSVLNCSTAEEVKEISVKFTAQLNS